MIDMHLHTTWSDGSLTTSDLVNKLYLNGITHAVLTDHDCILGYESFKKECQRKNIVTIPGVELEAYYDVKNSKYLHLLCYNYKNKNQLNSFLEKERTLRINAILEGIERVKNDGIFVSLDDVKKMSEGRHLLINHLCILLEKLGAVQSRFDAYDMFLNNNSTYHVSYPKYSVEEILELINSVGGVAVLAHPKRLNMNYDEKEKYIKYLKDCGIQGIEAYYSFDSASEREFSIEMSKKYNLIATVGSDWHCEDDNISFGNTFISKNEQKILKRSFFNE
ncbi:MAG: PHP domain-containing protein [Bacilli bacterium]|nr:PHP domain-containing protein [Bacilli bacterium]